MAHPDRMTAWESWLGWLGIGIVAALSIGPFFLDPHPTKLGAAQRPPFAWVTKGVVLLGILLAVGLRAWLDRSWEAGPFRTNTLLLLLAAAATACHWYEVDRAFFDVWEGGRPVRYYNVNWQRALYAAVLNHCLETHGELWIPHVFRPLPYGFTRSLELWTGDWMFACLAYRCLFTYWFVWGFYRFVRIFHGPRVAWIGLALYAALFPLSIHSYMGQLTDPMSHAFLVLALLAVLADRGSFLGAFLTLGVLAKDTAVVLVPSYLACWWRQGLRAWLRAAALAAMAIVAFLVVRLPFGWSGDSRSMNGSQVMVLANLGLSRDMPTAAPFYENYLQPFLFIGLFLPFVCRHWPASDRRLKALFLVLVPSVFLSNLVFSWLHESRNYVPLLPLLVTMSWPSAPSSLHDRQPPSRPDSVGARKRDVASSRGSRRKGAR